MSVNILHISDLHIEEFSVDECKISSKFQEPNFESKFFKKLKDSKVKIDFIIISGDLANTGSKKEYLKISDFLEELLKELNVKKSNTLICPGNHDINWNNNKCAFLSHNVKALKKGKPELKEDEAYVFHNEKFGEFMEFYNNFYINEKYAFDPKEALFQYRKINIKGAEICFCAINSCFKESFCKNNHFGFIDHGSLEKALKKMDKDVLKIFVLHHIPVSLNNPRSIENWEKEISFLCSEYNVRIFLFGHQHQSQSTSIIDGAKDFIEYSVGSLGKDGGENTFNILTFDYINKKSLQIAKNPFQYVSYSGNMDWQTLPDCAEKKDIPYNKPTINNVSPKSILVKEPDNYTFFESIEMFSTKLLEIIKTNNLFCSGHYHWNKSTRTLGLIDTYTLLSKREFSIVAKGAILELYNSHNINSEYILGLGQEGIVLGSFLARDKDLPFSSIPYHSRKNDYSKHEWELNLAKIKEITLITDVVCRASSIQDMLEEKENTFKKIKKINLLSLFYISKEEKYNQEIFKLIDDRIIFHTVCDKIKIDRCLAEPNTCPIFQNQLEKVHSFHS